MIIVIVWLVLSGLAGLIASNKGRSGIGFFFLSIALSPLVGIIAAAAVKPNAAQVETQKIESGINKKCAYCAELIKVEANVCRYCGRDLPVDAPASRGSEAHFRLWLKDQFGGSPTKNDLIEYRKLYEDLIKQSKI